MREVVNNKNQVNRLELFIQELKSLFKDKIVDEIVSKDKVYTYEFNTLFNKFELSKIKRIKDENIILEIAENHKTKKTILSIWENFEKEDEIC